MKRYSRNHTQHVGAEGQGSDTTRHELHEQQGNTSHGRHALLEMETKVGKGAPDRCQHITVAGLRQPSEGQVLGASTMHGIAQPNDVMSAYAGTLSQLSSMLACHRAVAGGAQVGAQPQHHMLSSLATTNLAGIPHPGVSSSAARGYFGGHGDIGLHGDLALSAPPQTHAGTQGNPGLFMGPGMYSHMCVGSLNNAAMQAAMQQHLQTAAAAAAAGFSDRGQAHMDMGAGSQSANALTHALTQALAEARTQALAQAHTQALAQGGTTLLPSVSQGMQVGQVSPLIQSLLTSRPF